MVYVPTWTKFESAVVDLYNKSPRKARYVVKFVPKTGQLVLKVTDDTTCLMYKTHSAIILNRFEALNLRLLSQMANVKRRALLSPPTQSGQATPVTPMTEDDPMGSPKKGGGASPRKGSPAPQAQPQQGGGGGKKKKKKGKR